MGLLSLETIIEQVHLGLDKRTDEQADPDQATGLANIVLWINHAYRHLSLPNVHEHPELCTTQAITLVQDDRQYALNTDLWAIKWVRHEERGRRLTPSTFEHMEDIRITSGIPGDWARFGRDLFLDRLPTSNEAGDTLNVRYWKQPTAFTTVDTDTQFSELNQVFDNILIVGGVWRGWQQLNNIGRADIARELWASLVNDVAAPADIEAFAEDWAFQIDQQPYQAHMQRGAESGN